MDLLSNSNPHIVLVVLVLSLISAWTGNVFIIRPFRNASKAKRLGCKPIPQIPTPWWDPLAIGGTINALRMNSKGNFLFWIKQQQDKASTITGRPVLTYGARLGGIASVWTNDSTNVQAILATHFDDFGLESIRLPMRSMFGSGIFTRDGPHWAKSRSMLRPSFTRDQISDLEVEDKHCRIMMKALHVTPDGWTENVDLQPIFFRQTIDRATEFLFGQSCGSQLTAISGDAPKEKDFAHAFDNSTEYIGTRFLLGELYWIMNSAEFRRWTSVCHEFIDYYVQLALGEDSAGDDAKNGIVGQKQKYIFLQEMVKQTRDPQRLRDEAFNILLAGRDTTAGTFSFMFALLASHKHVFYKLRGIILEQFGEYDPDGQSDNITFSALKSCQYLQYCINEVLRLYPQVASNTRVALRDTTLPRGGGANGLDPVFIPKGSPVQYQVYLMHRDQRAWGEDAEAFKPERWEGRKPGWDYLPFNGGPRICIGQQFALTSLGYGIVRMLQRFDDIEDKAAPRGSPWPTVVKLTLTPVGGVPVRLHEAKRRAA